MRRIACFLVRRASSCVVVENLQRYSQHRRQLRHEIGRHRAKLLRGKTRRGTTRTIKAVRNIIDWHLRSLWRDAEREGLASLFPRLDWPRAHRVKPDPFDADERDAILAWFARNEPYWCPWLFFCFGLVSATAKLLRCDGMTSI